MRWDFGKVYKDIRQSKGLTQEEICGDMLARSTLARIESGQVIPKFDTFIFLLQQINMSLEEFEYICNVYQPSERQKLLNIANNNLSITDNTELLSLKQQCQEYLQTHHDIPIQQLLDRLTVTIHVREFGGESKDTTFQETTQKIWHYLEKQNTWYQNDFKLLLTILYHFPLETLKTITPKILINLVKYTNLYNIKPLQLTLLTNLASIYLDNHQTKECETFSLEALKLAKELKRYDFLGIAQVRLGICRDDNSLIDKGMSLLHLTEEEKIFEALEKEVTKHRQI
ncbi:helix-turn-helix domain-containing protein [Streptococcus gallolyticus subsp. gallolyticus]|uniref:helix-turn-helix domain-containing protein n=1 Tax=Streptococcus gallolyticus TaxID=315405 RepID=UPI0022842A0E|nr:helix-turn-helix transcriptional regulator [Streptococcus gallolyticus]MCY7171135.1 helix-turn-helix domain-containing protein [Streptococcus gallolyticus subsp. gallolyticus]